MKSKSILQNVLFFLPILLLAKIFLPWLLIPSINSGDWPYYGKGMFDSFSMLAPFWTGQSGIGLGGVNPDFPIFSYLYFSIGLFVNVLHIPWEIVYKTLWFGLPLLLGIIGVWYLFRAIKTSINLWEISLGCFLYLGNTYLLMVSGGGQMGIVGAYAIAPIVIGSVIRGMQILGEGSNLRKARSALILGLFLSLQVLFDPRIAFLTIGIGLLYSIFFIFFIKKISFISLFIYLIISLIVVFLLHSYWIIPFLFFKLLQIPRGLTSNSGFSFFSFADFSHAFSFLHPNWPDNVFGKVYFLQPEFLVYPFFAFFGLLFVKGFEKRTRNIYLFFSMIALIGIFFAKGATEPFGGINNWIFIHLPGFNLFRDPTKYYLLIAMSYSVLIPTIIGKVYEKLKTEMKFPVGFRILLLAGIILLLVFPIREALIGKLGGTFVNTPVPQEYIRLGNFLSTQPDFFRTLWIPNQSRFRFTSENHTVLLSEDIFNTPTNLDIVSILKRPSEEAYLENLSVKYIIVPDDTTSEIFLANRIYDAKKRNDLIKQLDTVSYLRKLNIGNIVLYQLPYVKNHLYFSGGNNVYYRRNSGSSYTISIHSQTSQTLIFSEAFNSGWVAEKDGEILKSHMTRDGLNSFILPSGKYTLTIYFKPQKYQIFFYVGSGLFLIIFISAAFIL